VEEEGKEGRKREGRSKEIEGRRRCGIEDQGREGRRL